MRSIVAASLIFAAFSSASFAEMIHLHAKKGNIEGVLAELDKGVALEIRSTSMTSAPGVTPLFVAAKFGHVDLVKELLARGADPTIFFYQENGAYTVGTALHHAAGYGHTEVVRVLIEAGADPANYEPYISTPLHQALRAGNLEIANMLVEAGAPRKVEFPSIADAIAGADRERGAQLAKGCEICHGVPSRSRGMGNNGPNLWGVYGSATASDPYFEYSSYLRNLNAVWDADALNNYLASPYQFVPGTKKVMLGFASEDDRASLIAFLVTLSD
ncbi:ankyrin repeat domain-containing protein [Ruegeria sp. HKCCD8929]|uniref:ankyrin repeat domain-containing protein n=1 Tax=Ruegeria sp. HKCCD8929 TaxID=2683006 RepID=UPI0014879A46|nr:ankyrin repeat domain-containing protein [Ruegeria sp. HKCCD8929]